MNVQIENCGNTLEPCGVCGGDASKYVAYGYGGYRLTCNSPICLVTTIMNLSMYQDREDGKERGNTDD